MDGCFEITVDVEGELNLEQEVQQALQRLWDDRDTRLVVVKEPDCCPKCVRNDDPARVHPFGDGVHPNCRCRAVEVSDTDHRRDVERELT